LLLFKKILLLFKKKKKIKKKIKNFVENMRQASFQVRRLATKAAGDQANKPPFSPWVLVAGSFLLIGGIATMKHFQIGPTPEEVEAMKIEAQELREKTEEKGERSLGDRKWTFIGAAVAGLVVGTLGGWVLRPRKIRHKSVSEMVTTSKFFSKFSLFKIFNN